MVDGNGTLQVFALWDTVGVDSVVHSVPLAGAKVILSSEYGTSVYQAGPDGRLLLNYLPTASYNVSVRRTHPLDPNIVLVGSLLGVRVLSGNPVTDTVHARAISSTGICINEIYSAGPINTIFFFFDQFLELYNAGDSVRYLDGMMIMRVSGNNDGRGPGADEGNDGDIDGVTYAFRFPGKPGGQQYPLYPRQFVVLAGDAADHRTLVAGSVDLSTAEWEFYNQFSAEDIDNPRSPNLINMIPEKTSDFLISLTNDVIVLASGRDSAWADGIDITTVIDGVEYQSGPTSLKTLDPRIDRGFALSPPRYSGRAMQRRDPGSDGNDSSIDFEIIPAPTPGRH